MIRALPYRMGYSVHREHAQHQGRTITLAHEVRGLDNSGSLLHTIFFFHPIVSGLPFLSQRFQQMLLLPQQALQNEIVYFHLTFNQDRSGQRKPNQSQRALTKHATFSSIQR